jgi:RND family efflux transporter MFP subunit
LQARTHHNDLGIQIPMTEPIIRPFPPAGVRPSPNFFGLEHPHVEAFIREVNTMLQFNALFRASFRRPPAMRGPKLVGALLLAVSVGACDSSTGQERPADNVIDRPVLVVPVRYAAITETRSLAATIKPRIESDLGFRVAGKVARRLVQNGDVVRKGQALLVLDTNDLQLQLEQAQADVRAATTTLAQAEADEKRATTLEHSGWQTPANLDKARAAAAEARGRLTRGQRQVELATNALNYATLEADADGIITATPVEPGQVVLSGQSVVRLAHTGELETLVAVPETFVERARAATGSMTLWSLPDRKYEVKLRELSPAADSATRTYAARYTIVNPDEAVRLGMSATVGLTQGEDASAARLPLMAVFNHGRGPSVWVAGDAGKLMARSVTIARYEGQTVLIASGINEDENVVILGVEKLDEGLVVRPTASLSF